ncbi:MAG TPA: PIN domain nuclease [Kribbellaceae bacterium]|nr:PIN domain nuclease [Kribbellaceae bacterium]
MAVANYLVDKSALARLRRENVAAVLDPLVDAGLTAVCGMVLLESLFSSRDRADFERVCADMRAHEWLHSEDDDYMRVVDVQAALATKGCLRGVSLPDLLIAAVAERHRVTVMHYDSDFELIAEVTGQPTQWVVPRGSVA